MTRKKIRLEDGRYLIYFSFGKKSESSKKAKGKSGGGGK